MATGGWASLVRPFRRMEIPPKLKEYLDNNRSAYRDSLPPITDPDEPLQIDSLGLIRLITFLDNELGYRIEDEEMTADNFATLRALGELLASKTPTGPTGSNLSSPRTPPMQTNDVKRHP
jgi:acyl carrier protein